MEVQELRDWVGKWGQYLLAVERGEIPAEMTANI
jgi:hypothetical protein